MKSSSVQAALYALVMVCVVAMRGASAITGQLTYYGPSGITGACSSRFRYKGFLNVAMNAPQYGNGKACGACVQGCYVENGRRKCFKAIVDNKCPECPWGNIDMAQRGDGRWPLTWNFIRCPAHKAIFRTQGSNPYYGKLKIQGLGRILRLSCNIGGAWDLTSDGYWLHRVTNGVKLNCGVRCTIYRDYNMKPLVKVIPGSLFGGGCSKNG